MSELAKIATAMRRWGWGRTAFLLALFLLMRQFVTFDQAVVLILLAAILEHIFFKERLALRQKRPHPSVAYTNGRRRGG